MTLRSKMVITVTLCIVAVSPTFACLWDYDTLEMERQNFPSTLELITGKFLRHSKGFYQWRVKDRLGRLDKGESSPELYDDLAVAYDKLNEHEKAIAAIQKKEDLFPRRYETAANLGTFLIHAGRLEEGIVELDRALAINPDAHFGREIYQKLVVQYVLHRRNPPAEEPPSGTADSLEFVGIRGGFMEFLMSSGHLKDTSPAAIRKESTRARKGIEGMMKFGNFESPVLLEILGELLLTEADRHSSLLAARAFLKAEKSGQGPLAKFTFEELAQLSIGKKRLPHDDDHNPYTVGRIRAELDKEVADANDWFESLSEKESLWITAGKNADIEFTATYYTDPVSTSGESSLPELKRWMGLRANYAPPIAAIAIVGLLTMLLRFQRRRTKA